jgi:hypothetical protein
MSHANHSPIEFKDGIELLGRMDLIEFAVTAAISGDQGGPFTSSPTMRRHLALVCTDVARSLEELAHRIDPLRTDTIHFQKPDSAEDTTSPTEPGA